MSSRARFMAAMLGAGFLFAAGEAVATTITTTSLSVWESSGYTTGSATELNFGSIEYSSYNTSAGITLTPSGMPSVKFDFTGPDNGGYILSGVDYKVGSQYLNSLEGASDGVGSINVATPSSGENAIFLSIASTGSTPLTLLLSDGESFTGLSSGLFGFSISHPITWLSLSTTSGSQPVIDDFYYSTSSLQQDAPAAEVATFFLMGGGLLVLIGAKRKLRKLMN